ncbi:conserved Plasmodium protein, unknown function [Plasmodium gallinaceum]|uniref:Uncharacterized protein n=1 Tax=Plasmodium gallinaceum TaxID=5849 RepID=A0A1J1GWM0_PLAGA|nr:conserved Plasmodium protein, unknown function [Plasmodium gallinaceum]CRG96937.1 conserved Plasmodium protein, unknown function [Plasmodium gallinaceum]
MKKDKIKEKYIKALFIEVENDKIQNNVEQSTYNFFSSVNYDIYVFNKKFYKLKNLYEVDIKKTLLLYLFKYNFYIPKIIKRIIFKKILLQNESKDIQNFNYNIYLLLSYIKNPNINETTQKIIDLDVFRTRINKENEKTVYFFNLFLNYACSYFQFKYKQGLNEVLALFFYLKGKYFNMIDVYFCFQNFVEKFLKEFYYDDEFFFLQISFYLFKLLIKYHDPLLSEILEKNKMTPEIYASSWFLTLFASKSNLRILNIIYLIFLLEHNPFFYFFFSLALLILHRNVFLCVDNSNLPELLSKINIFNKKFLKKVWSLGKFLEKNTPISFVHKLFFIKNILIYLTNENSAENYNKKNILLNFFKSIDYMSINSYEIKKNISLGNDKYIFFDIRSNYHFNSFHMKNSINIELTNNYIEILKNRIDLQNKNKKIKKETKIVDKKIFYILKKYNNQEISRNDKLLFIFLLRSKYNLKNNITYDDNILLKKVIVNSTVSNKINFGALERKKRKSNKKKKKRKKKKEIFKGINLLNAKKNQLIDLNLFFFDTYKNKKYHKVQSKNYRIKFKSVEQINYKYIEQKKIYSCKKYYSDDDILSNPFSLTCYYIKNNFHSKIEKVTDKNYTKNPEINKTNTNNLKVNIETLKNTYSTEANKKKDFSSEDNNLINISNKIKKKSDFLEQNLNISSFNLYLLIKEKVLKNEDCLKFLFINILNSNKHIIILYDENFNNTKNVRKFYFDLIYNLKLKNVSIIEGGINSFHNLIKKNEINLKKNTTSKDKKFNDVYFSCNIHKNRKKLHQFHQSKLCYLCENKNIKNVKKKILDEFFYEIYNDFTIFEDFYYFLTEKRGQINFLSFIDLIKQKKLLESIHHNKKKENESSTFPLSNIINFIKRKKVEKEKNTSVLSVNKEHSRSNDNDNDDNDDEDDDDNDNNNNNDNDNDINNNNNNNSVDDNKYFTPRKNSNSSLNEKDIYNNDQIKKEYFNLNYYLDYYNKKKNEFLNLPSTMEKKYIKDDDLCNVRKSSKFNEYNFDEKMDIKTKYEYCNNNNNNNKDHFKNNLNEKMQKRRDTKEIYKESNDNLFQKNQKLTSSNEYEKSKHNSHSYIYNLYSYIDILCYNNLLYKDKCKIYNCFIVYVYQPLIPHNIRSNNIISSFIQYVKYIKNVKKNNNLINDPNIYLSCNKLNSNLFFNLSYFPFNNLRKINYPNSYLNSTRHEVENENSVKDNFLYQTVREELTQKKQPIHKNEDEDEYEEEKEKKINQRERNKEKNYNSYDEILNDSILNNTWIKNKPELGLCKLMIYDHLLILYGTPYLYDVNILIDKKKKKEDINNYIFNCDKEELKNLEKNNNENYNTLNEQNLKKNFKEEKDELSSHTDIGILNFLKEKKEYNNKEYHNLKYYDDLLQKMIIHKYKDLKKKDILFNIDCYKMNSIYLNWNLLSDHLFNSITKEHINDTYNYYKSYFNLSKNNLSNKKGKSYYSSSSSSNNTCSYISDEHDFSFSDYHSLYMKNMKVIKNSKSINQNKKSNYEYLNMTVDAINVYAVFDLRTIHKITTKRNSDKTLYFYFATNRNIPLMILNFENEVEVQSCVYSIKEVYSCFANKK